MVGVVAFLDSLRLRCVVINFANYLNQHTIGIPCSHCIRCDCLQSTTTGSAYLYSGRDIWIAQRTMEHNGNEAVDALHIDLKYPLHTARDRLTAAIKSWRMLTSACTLKTSCLERRDFSILSLCVD